ncbi:hypothetical protein [Chroococcidiopsis sp. CCNUC1]|nr:hypothetical protein [Chroococcidiopsis sp. CCNUC1]
MCQEQTGMNWQTFILTEIVKSIRGRLASATPIAASSYLKQFF